MPRQFYGVREDEEGHWVIVNKGGAIVSNNGWSMNILKGNQYFDQFGCSSYTGYSNKKDAEKQADEWERSYLIFEKPSMTTRELLLSAAGRIDWILALICALCIIKAFWK